MKTRHWFALIALLVAAGPAGAKNAQNFTGFGRLVCPCFSAGDQIAVVFSLPASSYPIEVTGIDVGWAAQFGFTGQSTEGALGVFAGAPPAPGPLLSGVVSPVLTAGAQNHFDIAPARINSGPFTVVLQLAHNNAGFIFSPSVVHDGNGCVAGRNFVRMGGGTWQDSRALGFTGDWVIQASYNSLVAPQLAASPGQVDLLDVPVNFTTCNTVTLTNTGTSTLAIRGITTCGKVTMALDTTATAHTLAPGQQTTVLVCVTPRSATTSGCELQIAHNGAGSPMTVPVNWRGRSSATPVEEARHYRLQLKGVVPNPFNPETTVRFELPATMTVTAEVWSVKGARIRTLVRDVPFPAGNSEIRWDGRNGQGRPIASGVYFIRIRTRAGDLVARAVLLE